MPTRDELEQQKKDDLLALAAERDLEGRSSMSKADLVEALADTDGPVEARGVQPSDYDDPTPPEQVAHQQAVNEGRTGLDPTLAAAKEAAREAAAVEVERPGPVSDPASDAEIQRIKRATRAAEEAAANRDLREGLAEV